jgi:predicted ATPase
LRERCNEARLGRGSLVFINGEAGIGKTRLVDEAIRRAKPALHHGKGFCLEHARSPLGPLADIVRTLHAADESVLTLARNVRRVLARLVPELETGPAAEVEAQGARSQYAAIAEMFRRFGERRPALLVIEDAHWADV